MVVTSLVQYDKLTLTDNSVHYIDLDRPNKNMTRPIEWSTLKGDNVSFYVFLDQPGGRTKLQVFNLTNISRVDYWEDLALSAAEGMVTRTDVDAKTLDQVGTLLGGIRNVAGSRFDLEIRTLTQRLTIARSALKCDPQEAVDVRSEGLAELVRYADLDRHMPGLEDAFVRTHIAFAQEAYRAKRKDSARDCLDLVASYYPKNKRLEQVLSGIRQVALGLLERSKSLEKEGKPAEALEALFEARILYPGSRDILAELTRLQGLYQVLHIAAYEKPGTCEPFNATLPLEKQISTLIFDSLLEPDEGGKGFHRSPLVKSLELRPGGGGYLVELNPVPFSDQSLLSAEDVEQSLLHWRDLNAEARQADLLQYIRQVTPKGPLKLEILFEPHPRPEMLLTFLIAPKKHTLTLPTRGSPFSQMPIGSGPFQVGKQIAGADFRLIANANYREAAREKPYLKELHFQYVVRQGAGQAIADLEAERLHMIADPSPNQIVQLQRMPHRYRCRPFMSNNVWVLAFNFRNPVFNNSRVRDAVYLAIDREKILEQYFGLQGQGQFTHRTITGPFPPQSNAYNTSLRSRSADPVGAKKIVDQLKQDPQLANDLTRPWVLKFPTKGDVVLEQAIVQIKKDLIDAGFQVEMAPKLPNDYQQEVERDHDFDLAYFEVRHSNVLCNVEPLFDAAPHQSDPGGSNFMGYRDQTLQQLFVDLRNEQVGDKIWTIQHRIHNYLYTNMVIVPLWRLDRYVAYSTRLKGRTDTGGFVELPVSNAQLFRHPENWYLEPRKQGR